MKKNDKKGNIKSANNPPPLEIKLNSSDDTSQFAENIINTVREPLIVLDQDLKVVAASRSFYKFFKVNSDETVGRLIYDLGNKQWDIPKLRELLETILPEKATFDNYEVEHDFSTIGKRTMLLNARQIERAFGKEKIILLAIEDITERKGIEKSLSEKSRLTGEYLKILLDHAHAPIIIWNSSFIIKRFNHGFEKLSGYNSAEIQDKKLDILFPKNKIDSTLELIKNKISDEDSEVIEIDILTKDYRIKTVLWNSANILDKEGENIVATIAQDITSRKQTEEALTILETRYRRLFESAKDGILLLNADTGKIIDVNPFLIELLGYSKEQFLEKEIWEIGFFKNIAANKDKFLELLQKEYVRYEDLPLETSDGRQIDVEFVSNVYPVNSHKVIQCNIRDITERKQALESIKSNELKFRTLADFTFDMEYWEDKNKQIIYISPSCKKFTGYTQDEFIADPKLLDRIIHPDDFISVFNHHDSIYSYKNRENLGELEFRIIRKDKSVINIYHTCRAMYNEDKKYLGRRVSNRDITERKLAEDKLRSSEERFKIIFDYAPDAYYINDLKGNFVNGNFVAEKLLGYNRDELIGKSFLKLNLLSPIQLLKAAKLLTKNLVGQATGPDEFVINRKDGSKVTIEISTYPVKIKDQTFVLGIARDITVRKLAEQELIEAKEKAEEMNKLKSSFLANMSHELRTPLIGINGYAEFLSDELKDPELKEMAENILKSGSRLSETLNLILDISKLESEKLDLLLNPVDLVIETKDIINIFKETARKKGLYLGSSFSNPAIYLNTDKRAFRSIVNNLLNNAIKYTSQGEITTSVSLKDNFVEIKVADSGIGIAKKDHEIIFEEFRQASEGYNRNFEGTGLGLSITKKLVEKFGGKISVESEEDKGSTFTVMLPLTEINEKKQIPFKETCITKEFSSQKKVKKLALLVDDDPVVFNVLKRYISEIVDLDSIPDAEFAINMLKKKNYDIVFMDINLRHGIDGKEAAEEIRKIKGYESIPIIATTAYAMAGDKEEFLAAGCSHYLQKPFTKEDVLNLLNEIFSGK